MRGPIRSISSSLRQVGRVPQDSLTGIATSVRHHGRVTSEPVTRWLNDAGGLLTGKARARHRTVPSGHVAYAISLFGMVACVLLQQGHVGLAAAFAVIGLAMGPARILDGGHLLTDVAAGYAFGLAWLLTILLVGFAWAVPA